MKTPLSRYAAGRNAATGSSSCRASVAEKGRTLYGIVALGFASAFLATVAPWQLTESSLAALPQSGTDPKTGEVDGGDARRESMHLFDRLVANEGRVGRVGRRVSMFLENANVAGDRHEAGYRMIRVVEEVIVEPRDPHAKQAAPRFAVRVLSVDGEGLSDSQKDLRKAQLEAVEGFAHHYGGFRIRDLAQAKKNYRVLRHAHPVPKHGRVFRLYDVLPVDDSRSSYRLLVDEELGVIADEVEIAPSGVLVRSRFYLTLRLGTRADLGTTLRIPDNVEWWRPWNQVREHGSLAEAQKASGTTGKIPPAGVESFVPFSYRSATHSVTKQRYLILGYTDGIDFRFLLQSKMSVDAFEEQTGLLVDEEHLRVFHCQLGPAPQYFAYRDGLALILVGNFHPSEKESATQPGAPTLPEMFTQVLR